MYVCSFAYNYMSLEKAIQHVINIGYLREGWGWEIKRKILQL